MPAASKAQQRLMGAAEHGAPFPLAQKLRQSMTHQQLHDFASGPEKGKPEHVKKPKAKSRQAHSTRGHFTSDHAPAGRGSLSTRPRVIKNPKTLSGRRDAAHAKAYPDTDGDQD